MPQPAHPPEYPCPAFSRRDRPAEIVFRSQAGSCCTQHLLCAWSLRLGLRSRLTDAAEDHWLMDVYKDGVVSRRPCKYIYREEMATIADDNEHIIPAGSTLSVPQWTTSKHRWRSLRPKLAAFQSASNLPNKSPRCVLRDVLQQITAPFSLTKFRP